MLAAPAESTRSASMAIAEASRPSSASARIARTRRSACSPSGSPAVSKTRLHHLGRCPGTRRPARRCARGPGARTRRSFRPGDTTRAPSSDRRSPAPDPRGAPSRTADGANRSRRAAGRGLQLVARAQRALTARGLRVAGTSGAEAAATAHRKERRAGRPRAPGQAAQLLHVQERLALLGGEEGVQAARATVQLDAPLDDRHLRTDRPGVGRQARGQRRGVAGHAHLHAGPPADRPPG